MSEQSIESAGGTFFDLGDFLAVRGFGIEVDLQLAETPLGTVAGEAVYGPSRGILEGSILGSGSTIQEIREDAFSTYGDLIAVLLDGPTRFRQESRTSRYLAVYPERFDDTPTLRSDTLRIRIPLLAPDPRWRDAESSQTESRSGSDWDFTITNAGTLRVPVTLELTDATIGSTAATFRNRTTGQLLTYSDELEDDEELLIDGANRLVQERSSAGVLASRLAFVDDGFLIGGLHLDPGDNEIEIRNVSGSGAQVELEWQAAYSS